MTAQSPLHKARASYQPRLPAVFAGNGPFVAIQESGKTESVADQEAICAAFPHTYGLPLITFDTGGASEFPAVKVAVVLSGGQAPGGHNVISGLYDALKAINENSELYGFLGGPSGLTDNHYKVLTGDVIDAYRNTGGFDIIGSGRTKLETPEQFEKVAENCRALGIQAVVIIGGDDSNTNACVLAEYFLNKNLGIQVIGCPKTIDGDLKNEQIETSFGFDTATKVYSELIGNIERDANSAKKYWHFIKLMGRSASHIALECALQTHPTITIISEEVAANNQTLQQMAQYIATVVADRAKAGMDFGVVLVPEGLIEFIPEMKALIAELNELLAENDAYFKSLEYTDDKLQFVNSHLGAGPSQTFSSLPGDIQLQLLMDRDPHGNVQVSRIETEKLLIDMTGDLLREWHAKGNVSGKFSTQSHFFGYEGRCAAPSNFDADYCYSLGYAAACLIANEKTGYMAAVKNLSQPAGEWSPGGVPLTMMMNMERRKGKDHPVIKKALVNLEGAPFKRFATERGKWANGNEFVFPGPIQYFGPPEVCDRPTMTLELESR
ncbi:MAG: diphosphate--fructose-6-phosphate 1-phosphotransferase [Candidatus Pacebacteria bacterium]|nr:diphosphate--fructose-6-phosphate 1-phosphotransferase [Candidatus Paceibacterota bacterium]